VLAAGAQLGPYKIEARIGAGVPKALFQALPRISGDIVLGQWAPSPDGKRFLFLVPEAQDAPPFTVVLNWQAGLKK